MCWQRKFDKVYHINNYASNQKICDIHLNLTNNHSLWIDNTAGNISQMSVNVDGNEAKQEGEMGTNCCGCKYNIIRENMAVHIKYDSIPQLFSNNKVEWVLNLGPIFDKPYSRMHLYINGKNVLNPNETVDTFTNQDYKCSKCCTKLIVFLIIAIGLGLLYAFICSAFIGELAWYFAPFWILFGAATFHHILACTAKAVCECSNPGLPKEVNVTFDPNSGAVINAKAVGVELVVNNATNTNMNRQINNNNKLLPLPAGWIELKTNDGKVYYQNNETKATQWERPQNVQEVQQLTVVPSNEPVQVVVNNEEEASAPPLLPRGWTIMYTDDGRKYYQNDITKKTQWELPTEQAQEQQEGGNKVNENEDVLPSGWTKVYTPDGKVYYQNDVTKATTWQKPT